MTTVAVLGLGVVGAPVPLAVVVRDRMSEARRLGRDDHDIAGFVTVIREAAGLSPRR